MNETPPKTAEEKVAEIEILIRDWAAKEGHESCWYYPRVFEQIAEVLGVSVPPPPLPGMTREQFEEGCRRYGADANMSEPMATGGIVPPPKTMKAKLFDNRLYTGILRVSGTLVIHPGSSDPVPVMWLWTSETQFTQIDPSELANLEAE